MCNSGDEGGGLRVTALGGYLKEAEGDPQAGRTGGMCSLTLDAAGVQGLLKSRGQLIEAGPGQTL